MNLELTHEQIVRSLGETPKSGPAAQAQASYGAQALEADRASEDLDAHDVFGINGQWIWERHL